MSRFKYTPDADLKIHEVGAIKLICSHFQSHEDGIPELIKNSSDAYARIELEKLHRNIVIIFNYKGNNSSVSCLDLVGMTSTEIENNFRHWADPYSAKRGSKSIDIQGGHGNGGKCYMTQMFNEYSRLYTVKEGKGNVYGVPGNSIKFGYIPNIEEGKNFIVTNTCDQLVEALDQIGCALNSLPKKVIEALKISDGFSLVTGIGPKGYRRKIPVKNLINTLKDHSQMLRSLQLCNVYIIENGKLLNAKKPLDLPTITPMKGAETKKVTEIPSKLKDPVSQEIISTTNDGKNHKGVLHLYTSNKSMRYNLKYRHTIRFINDTFGDFGYVYISELDIQSPYRDRIYGTCSLDSLYQFKQNNRARLGKSPVTRAVESFISSEIQKYAKEFEAKDKKKYSKEEKNAVTNMNDALDNWKNQFLSETMKGLWGIGEDSHKRTVSHLPTGIVERIELSLSHNIAGRGISMRPILHFFNSNNERIKSVPHHWLSENNNIALVDEQLMIINTFAFGETYIYAETEDGKCMSNKIPLKVVHIKDIKIEPNEIEIEQGGRLKLSARCKLDDGSITTGVLLDWQENDSSVVKVSSSGMIYGFNVGETTIVAWDENCTAQVPAKVKVVHGSGKGEGDEHGKGFPKVLISGEGFDCDPLTKDYINFSYDDPPVYQRPEDSDRNIWWINSASPFASLYLDKSKGYGYNTREWRMYHVERYIDIIVQILLTQSPSEDESNHITQWIMKWMFHEAEIQTAALIDLEEFLTNGQLPLGR